VFNPSFFEFHLQSVIQNSVPRFAFQNVFQSSFWHFIIRILFKVQYRVHLSECDSGFKYPIQNLVVCVILLVNFRFHSQSNFLKNSKKFDYNLVLKYVKISLLNYAQWSRLYAVREFKSESFELRTELVSHF